MIFAATLLIEIVLLFFLSRVLTRAISKFLIVIVKNRQVTIWILALLFLPGVIIHELSHLLSAVILFVPVGEVEFIPKIMGESVKLGSVKIAKTDFLRRILIGFSPVFFGSILLFFLLYYIAPNITNFSHINFWALALALYAVFQISNTMFSSKKDIEESIIPLIVIFILLIIIFIIKNDSIIYLIRHILSSEVLVLIKNVNLLLLIPLSINFVFILLLKLFLKRI